ncbi:MAG: methionyl-tRNA formyltransferase [Campylobacterales bacterium]
MTKVVIAGGQNLGNKVLDFLIKSEFEVVGVIARADDSGSDSVFPSLLNLALKNDIPVIKPTDVNSDNVLNFIKNVEADILLSIMYNQIFKKQIVSYFGTRLGIVNIHYAPLPKYCGFWPEMWAIWNDEKKFGFTYHYVDEGVDTGKVIYQEAVDIESSETRKTLYEKCDKLALSYFIDAYKDLLTRKQKGYLQDFSNRSYYNRMLPNDGFIDLNWEKEKIERFIRATSFYPFVGAKIKIGEKVYSVIDKDLEFFKPHYIGEEK